MPGEEIVNAYLSGAISRRTLIRRLVAGGVSLGAATAYAHHLAPESHAAPARGSGPFEYPRVNLRILSDDLGKVIEKKKLSVRVRSSDPCKLRLLVLTKHDGAPVTIGERSVTFGEAGNRRVGIGIDRVGPLRRRGRARVTVIAISDEGAYQPRVARDSKRLER